MQSQLSKNLRRYLFKGNVPAYENNHPPASLILVTANEIDRINRRLQAFETCAGRDVQSQVEEVLRDPDWPHD